MDSAVDVIIVSEDPSVAQRVTDAVKSSSHLQGGHCCRNLDELAVELTQRTAVAVFVDIDAAPGEILLELRRTIDRFLGTRFIVIASEQRDDWVIQAMQAGARDYLKKSAIAASLPGVLERLAPATSPNGELPHAMTTILSAGGGCGATTLAVNLAYELKDIAGGSTLLVDLDECFAGVAGYFDLSAEYSIADVLADESRIDAHLVRSTAVTCRQDMHVLLSPATTQPGFPRNLNLEHLRQAMRAAKMAYRHCVIDAPRVASPVAIDLARLSTAILLIMEPNVDDIRIARRQLANLLEAGILPDRVWPVVNRFHKRRSLLGIREVEKALGFSRVERLSEDAKGARSGINYGKVLADVAPRSALRREIRRLAQRIDTARDTLTPLGKVG